LCSSLNVRDQVLHPYNFIGNNYSSICSHCCCSRQQTRKPYRIFARITQSSISPQIPPESNFYLSQSPLWNAVPSYLRRYPTSPKAAGSIPDYVIGFLN
jgi:hypothetical protein